ncbi:hypothetical protein ACVWWN_000369 [Mycobacterium sp. URHB0021]
MVFDLDPGEGVTFGQLCEVAHEVRELITGIGLTILPLTSGSKGLHLYVPLETPISSHGASVLARRIAVQLEKPMPKRVTATMTKSLRTGKVFVDWSQNNGNKTTIAPYSLRGREEPTVAAPRTWDEIEDPDLRHLRFEEVLERLDRDGDLLAEMDADAPVADALSTYRSMRDAGKTPEPVPNTAPITGNDDFGTPSGRPGSWLGPRRSPQGLRRPSPMWWRVSDRWRSARTATVIRPGPRRTPTTPVRLQPSPSPDSLLVTRPLDVADVCSFVRQHFCSPTSRRKLRAEPSNPAARATGSSRLAEILPFDLSTRAATRSVNASRLRGRGSRGAGPPALVRSMTRLTVLWVVPHQLSRAAIRADLVISGNDVHTLPCRLQ